MTALNALLYALGILTGGAVLTLLVSKSKQVAGWLAFLCTAASSLLALYATSQVLLKGPTDPVTYFKLWGSGLRLYVDGLSAIFIALIAVVAFMAALFSIKYMEHYKEYGVASYYPYFLLFIVGMYGIVITTDMMVFFCFFWQLMTLTSYALVRYEYKKPENVRAANRYLLMMELACALVMIAVAMLAQGNIHVTAAETLMKYDFDAISAGLPGQLAHGGGLVAIAFLLFLVGFGIKAGMWPFGQMWLPDAHPAAPSPVSALLSGVMIKTGVYGLIRTFLWLVPKGSSDYYPSEDWGLVIAVLGTLTLFLGTMQALKQEQTKRLLAFHSIGQVGYILLGLGAAVTLFQRGLYNPQIAELAGLALCAALFHTLNHGTFKSLLFLNAGSILKATDTQDLNKLGGLMKFMPATGVLTLIASFSIAGVPLFNGFASKWTLYVACLLGSAHFKFLAICGLFAILTSALTLASFIKFFGTSFLSRTSTLVKAKSEGKSSLEMDWSMLTPKVLLATICVAFGVMPAGAYTFLHSSLVRSPGGLSEGVSNFSGLAKLGGVAASGGGWMPALFMPLVLLVVVAVLMLLAYGISRLGGAERRVVEPWLCGYARESDYVRYSAHNLYGEFKKYFGWVGGKPRPVPPTVEKEENG